MSRHIRHIPGTIIGLYASTLWEAEEDAKAVAQSCGGQEAGFVVEAVPGGYAVRDLDANPDVPLYL